MPCFVEVLRGSGDYLLPLLYLIPVVAVCIATVAVLFTSMGTSKSLAVGTMRSGLHQPERKIELIFLQHPEIGSGIRGSVA